MTVRPHSKEPVPTFNWVVENQPIAHSQVAKKSRKQFADEKGPQQGDPGSCLVMRLYL